MGCSQAASVWICGYAVNFQALQQTPLPGARLFFGFGRTALLSALSPLGFFGCKCLGLCCRCCAGLSLRLGLLGGFVCRRRLRLGLCLCRFCGAFGRSQLLGCFGRSQLLGLPMLTCGADTVTRLQARYVEFQRGLSVAVDRMAASTFILVRPSSIHNLLNFCSQFSTRKLSCNLRLQLNFRAT